MELKSVQFRHNFFFPPVLESSRVAGLPSLIGAVTMAPSEGRSSLSTG